jgi:hypothetical protein
MRVLEKRVVSIFRPNRDEVAGGWRRLHNKELLNSYSSQNIRVIKSERLVRTGIQLDMGRQEMRKC